MRNAYVLLSQHRFSLAASFFLLGGDRLAAATVCFKNMGDPQLALVVARLTDGPDRSILNDLIWKTMLPAARTAGDRWQVWMLEVREGGA